MLNSFTNFFGNQFETKLYTNFKITREIDNISNEEYFIISDLVMQNLNKDEKDFLKSIVNYRTGPVAKVGSDAHCRLEDNNLLIFKNTHPAAVRSILFDDHTLYPFSISFKTVEYHTYMTVTEKATNKQFHFGIAPKEYNAWQGYSYLRDETIYDRTYFKNHVEIDHTQPQYLYDWNSTEIAFDLTDLQVQTLEQFLKNQLKLMHGNQVEYQIYNNNCDKYAADIFNLLFNEDHFGHYYVAEKLDLKDKGSFSIFLSTHPYSVTIKHFDKTADLLFYAQFQESLYTAVNKVVLKIAGIMPSFLEDLVYYKEKKEYLDSATLYGNTKMHVAAYNGDLEFLNAEKAQLLPDQSNYFGDTPLHIALKYGQYQCALKLLELGANPNMLNKQGFSPLHYVLDSKLSQDEKYGMVQTLLDKGALSNIADKKGYSTPLILAAKTQDLELFKLLAGCSDLYYKTPEGNNVAHIAIKLNLQPIWHYLQTEHPNLFTAKNLQDLDPYEFGMQLNSRITQPRYALNEINFPFGKDNSSVPLEEEIYDNHSCLPALEINAVL